jgi:hypothetical protein
VISTTDEYMAISLKKEVFGQLAGRRDRPFVSIR